MSEYYKKQERLLEGFNEMETIHETGFASGAPTEVRLSIPVSLLFVLFKVSSIYPLSILNLFVDSTGRNEEACKE